MLFSLLLVKRGHPVLAGVVMAFAVMMKVTPLIFLLFFWLKRQWKVLGGMVLGFFLAAILIPSLVLSPPKSRVAHRQFFGRIVKPIVVEWATTFRKEIPQPMKRSAEMIRYNRMVGYLSERNQSLQGSLTRLFLKDRREFSHDNPPIRVAWHYENLPVLFGGIPAAPLRGIARGIYFLILLILVYLWYPYHKKESNGLRALELTLVFLSMPLLSPWTRSHQFLSWIFALFAIINLPYLHLNGEALRHEVKLSGSPQASILIWALRVAGTLYFLQALPYGKAAGVGTWANLVFWSGFAAVIYQVKHAKICR
jgi:hypothetical protein